MAPSEIVTIFGQNFGPSTPTTAGGVQILFDGIAANVFCASATQLNAVVPSQLTGPTTNVTVTSKGTAIAAGSFGVTSSAPGIFTSDGSGQGQAAVLNQDGSVNSPTNPAARGSIVQIFGTGRGVSDPDIPVTVTIDGKPAMMTYSGQAPGEIAGLLQVNAMIPADATTGSMLPFQLGVGTSQSAGRTFISIQ